MLCLILDLWVDRTHLHSRIPQSTLYHLTLILLCTVNEFQVVNTVVCVCKHLRLTFTLAIVLGHMCNSAKAFLAAFMSLMLAIG